MKHQATTVRTGLVLLLGCASLTVFAGQKSASNEGVRPAKYLSPAAVAASPSGNRLYVACATANQVLVVDTASGEVTDAIAVAAQPLGMAVSGDGKTLFVTCAAPQSKVCVVDLAASNSVSEISTGHTAMAPVLSPDGQTLYVCNRFDNDVAFIDIATRSVRKRLAVPREPVAADLTKDGRFLLVAHHLHAGPSDVDYVASTVTVIDAAEGKVIKELTLPNGSGMLRDVRVSPDGKFACVTHLLSRFHLPTTQIERGWINSNALTLIDLAGMTLINTVLLDNVDRGAANPWAAAWSLDSKSIYVTHAGTHEVSVIDWPALQAKLGKVAAAAETPGEPREYVSASRTPADVPNDLAFLTGVRQRINLPESDRGPRAIAVSNGSIYTANYFTDSLTRIALAGDNRRAESIPLGNAQEMTQIRRGELLFNDAALCFQGWQTCASCHSSDGRIDGLNWDNLNDGIGNPKNVKSLLLSHVTPPSMAMGVREDAEYAVRAGIRHSLFTVRPEEDAVALDEYLKSLQPIPSPHLENDELSAAAKRGKKLFFDSAGCVECHRPPLYTNLKSYNVGTAGKFDQATDRFDTPSLIELWRTAPYLHDGRAVTVEEAVTHWNKDDKRGRTSHLNGEQVADLVAFLLSL